MSFLCQIQCEKYSLAIFRSLREIVCTCNGSEVTFYLPLKSWNRNNFEHLIVGVRYFSRRRARSPSAPRCESPQRRADARGAPRTPPPTWGRPARAQILRDKIGFGAKVFFKSAIISPLVYFLMLSYTL